MTGSPALSRPDLEAFALAAATAVQLEVDPAHWPQVIDNLDVGLEHARRVLGFRLPPEAEPEADAPFGP